MMENKQQEEIIKLDKKLGLGFKNVNDLKKSFIHRSYLNENRNEKLESNERLEFLGDAVLELVVTEYLFNRFNYPEGELTALRSALVRGKNLSDISESLGIHKCIYLSEGEKRNEGKARSLILANTFEALIGNVYLEMGIEKAKKIVVDHIVVKLDEIIENKLYIDNKSEFQEKVQERMHVTPSYKIIKQNGPDHAKQFTVGVYVNEELIAVGEGSSKSKAEQEAARLGFTKIFS